MDNPVDGPAPGDGPPASDRWAPAPLAVGAAAVVAVGALALAVLADDPAGRVLFALAALGLGVAAVAGAGLRPRLCTGTDGLTLRGVTGRRHVPWGSVADIRVVRTPRLGRVVSTLEITTRDPDGLVVLSLLELGAEPDDVLAALLDTRAA